MTDESETNTEQVWTRLIALGESVVKQVRWNVYATWALAVAVTLTGVFKFAVHPDWEHAGDAVTLMACGVVAVISAQGWLRALQGKLELTRHMLRAIKLLELARPHMSMFQAVQEAHAQGLPIVIHPPGVEPPEGHQDARPVLH